MRAIPCLMVAALVLAACAGKTAQDLSAEERTPQVIFSQICSRCHGEQGRDKAFGVSKVIADMSREEIETALIGFRNGTYGGTFKGVMQKQAGDLSEQEIPVLALYVSSLGGSHI